MNMCYLIKLHVDMLTLFKGLLTNEEMSIQKVRMKKIKIHLACGNNHDEVVSILCMVLNLFFTSFFVSYILSCINYANIICELYA
jgi:hypothetical protein